MSKANGFVSFNCVPVRTGLVAIGGQVKHTCLLIEIWVSLWLADTEWGGTRTQGELKEKLVHGTLVVFRQSERLWYLRYDTPGEPPYSVTMKTYWATGRTHVYTLQVDM